MASQDWLEKDFYKILGVEKDISAADLKKRYRKLARDNHPDTHPGDTAKEERFKQISEAYSVLSDEKQRAEYDQIRAMGAGGARFSPGAGGFEDIFGGSFGGFGGRRGGQQYTNADFEDLLGQMFGGQAGGMGGRGGFGTGFQAGPQKGRDQRASVTIDFRAAALGETKTFEADGRKVSVRIPAGVDDGQTIRLRGKGAPSPNGGEAGDLLLKVSVRPHEVFSKEGKNLVVELPVTFAEAVRGATVEVPTLDGDTVRVKVPAGSSSGKTLRVRGRGIATKSAKGDLLVKLVVAVPSHLTSAQEEALDAFIEASPAESPREDLLRKAKV